MQAWYNRLREALQRERLPAVLVGNKADLAERVEVTRQDANAFGERMRLPVVEASAMPPGQDIEGGFQALAALLAAQEVTTFNATYYVAPAHTRVPSRRVGRRRRAAWAAAAGRRAPRARGPAGRSSPPPARGARS